MPASPPADTPHSDRLATSRIAVAETELLVTKERLAHLVETSPAVIYSARVSGDFGATYISPNVKRQMGYVPEDFTKKPGFWVNGIHPDDRERVLSDLSALFEPDSFSHEYGFLRVDGTYRWMRDDCRLVRNAAGDPLEIVGSWIDITERKQAEEEMMAQGADRVHREALAHVSRVATIGELTASIAHELNQPLAAIVTNAQAASRFLAQTTPDLGEVDDALRDIAGDAKRAGEVIRHMRDLLKTGERREDVVDMNSLMAETVEMLHSDAILRNVSVVVELEKDLPPVSGDPIQLQQVILNLIVNAFEALSKRDDHSGTLVIRASCSDGWMEINFTDNGGGFPDDLLVDLFVPFRSSKPEGLGMGLSISRTIVEAHGGQLLAENNPDGGASLRIILPVNSGEED